MNIYQRLDEYRSGANKPIVPELEGLFVKHQDDFLNILKLTGGTEDSLRSFSPLAKGFLKPKQLVYANQQFIPQERAYIKQYAKAIIELYGDPIFQYTGYNDRVPAVRQFQALQRFSPKVTLGANKRRFDNLQQYFTPKQFKPNMAIWRQTIQIVRELLDLPAVSVQFEPEYVRGLFAGHASNVGYPYFRNELSTDRSSNTNFRETTVKLSTELLNKYNSAKWICAIPALIIGRDQPGGNTLDITKNYTSASLLKALDHIEYKPSKARPVGAIARVVNNLISPVLKAIIKHPKFLSNPQFCGFLSREARFPYMKKYDGLAKQLNLIPVNIDFSAFDTSISAEMLLTALDLCFETVTLNKAPADLLDAIKASAIYTNAIAMDPYTKSIFRNMKTNAIASGHGTTGYSGYVCALLAMIYAYITLYGVEGIKSVTLAAKKTGTAFSFGLGDDFLGLVKNLSDIPKIAKIVHDAFGMVISVESTKTAVGVDFLQELYGNNSIEYPIARLAPSALYTERSSGKGFALGDMSFASMLYNLRTNPERTLDYITSIFQALDATSLGLFNLDGQRLSLAQFMEYVKRETAARDATEKQLLGDGDPAKEVIFDKDDTIKSDYMSGGGSLISRTEGLQGAFSTSALRTFGQEFKKIK